MSREASPSDSTEILESLLEDRGYSRARFLQAVAASGASLSGLAALAPRALAATGSSRAGLQKQQIAIATSTTPAGLDPATFGGYPPYEIWQTCYTGLLEWKQIKGPIAGSLSIDWAKNPRRTVPKLAQSWTESRDRLRYTFSLRRGIMSTHGNELTAADVEWNYRRAVEVPGIQSFLYGVTHLKNVRALDKYTVQFQLSSPSPLWPVDLADYGFHQILDSTELKKHATSDDPWAQKWISSNIAGWGPYRLTSFVPGREMILEKVDGYPFPGKIPRIVFRVVPESAGRLALLSGGAVDAAANLSPQELKRLESTSGVKIWNFKSNPITGVGVNFKFKPLNDRRVRQALAYAIPYDAIIKNVYLGYATPAYGPLPTLSGSVNKSLWTYKLDVNRAKRLLADAGYANGFTTTYVYPTSDPLGELIGIQLRSSWAKIGVKLNLRALPESPYQQALYQNKNAPLIYWSVGSDLAHASYIMPLFWGPKGSANITDYRNPKVTAMLARADKMKDWDAQEKYLSTTVAKELIADLPWLWIAEPGYQIATRTNLTGINWHAGVIRWHPVGVAA